MTQAPQPGWYADPSGLPAHRWWDGQAWTQHTQQMPAPQAPSATQSSFAPAPATQHAGFGSAPMQTGYAPTATQSGFGTPQYAPAPARNRAPVGVWASNQYAFITMLIVAAYALIAWKGHVYVLGIFPAAMSVRSMNRREPLAILAVIAAVAAVLIAVVGLTHH